MRSVAEVGRRFPLPPYRGWYRSGLGAQASLPRTIKDKGLESSPTLSLLFRVLTASLISSVFFLIAASNDSSPSAERCGSAAPESGSAADAGRRRLQPVVRLRYWERPCACLGLCACFALSSGVVSPALQNRSMLTTNVPQDTHQMRDRRSQ